MGKEVHLWQAPRSAPGSGAPTISMVSQNTISAGLNLKAEMVGKWTQGVYEMPDDVLVKINVNRSAGGQQRQANILLKTRAGAALTRIAVDTIPHERQSLRELIIEGRFDILNLDDASVLGYVPPMMYRMSFDRERWSRHGFIHIREMAPETQAPVRVRRERVENSQGEVVEVQSSHRRRALDL